MTTEKPPKPEISDAPGLKWLPRKVGWEARWRARLDLVRRGYQTASVGLWRGAVPDEAAILYIRTMCDRLQTDMLMWARGGVPELQSPFSGTLESLVRCYQTDPDSKYRTLRYQTRLNYDHLCGRIIKDHGSDLLSEIKARDLLRWHEKWAVDGKVAMAHAMVGMLRTVVGFGHIFLEDQECARLKEVLHDMRFKMPKPRGERITAEQAAAVIAKAHEMGLHSIALAQAFQFELALRQKDVIGEWVPVSEPGLSLVTAGNEKWMIGMRWSEIDENLIFRHTTSKRQKDIEVNLRLAPMVIAELARLSERPTSGPIVVYEQTNAPYHSHQFRQQWRRVATAAGIPADTFNMDSRSGAISEATDAGVPLEHVRHMATHSNSQTTAGYSRGSVEKTADAMRSRVEHRNKK
jgi:hypothetical protein